MELDSVAFPAIIVAADGWVEYVQTKSRLCDWTTSAVRKYSKCRVLIYDHFDHVWLVVSILPRQRRNSVVRLVDAVRNPTIAIEVQVQAVVGTPIETVRDALLTAIEADDDILTQNLDASELKVAIQKASSFEAVVQVLRTARAIEV